MDVVNSQKKIVERFPFAGDRDKIRCFALLIGAVREDKKLMEEIYGMAARAYHPLSNIETWMEARFAKNITLTPAKVAGECMSCMRLDRRMSPVLRRLAVKVKAKMRYRVKMGLTGR